jgi:undecaprenyl pyrophosphate phosphatase UppP
LAKIAETATVYFVDDSPVAPMSEMIITWGIGITTSFVVGVLTIHYFLKLVKRIGPHYFAFYRIIFAAILFLELRSVSNLIID